ncbi:SIMPL domain-containing protein [Hyphomicrobium sp. 99]|uniref:SIMPL domain-containing protein n=1 Tax=Hyphomicrobium sp. 99 TaxID=1163419 RepID=UPI0005F837DE|nr:SIMPL domain-containing protein [Hyphomicrobium sp. 99]
MLSAPRSRTIVSLLNIALASGFLLTQATALHAQEQAMERTITVSATGTAEAEPDSARITSGVTTEAKTAREALSANSETMSKVIEQLKASGIYPKDIQTAAFNVEPVLDYSKDGQPPVLRGYRVSNQVVVFVRELPKLGEILDEIVSAGANQIQGLTFEVSKEDTLKDEARKVAIANALRRAKLLATAAGAEVGNVMQISEETTATGPVMYAPRMAKATAAAPIETGTSTLEARVTVTWALK